MEIPSIKGTAYGSVHEDLHRLVESGRVSRDELEVRLTAEELKHFESKVLASQWYPITTYRALLAIVADKEAKGSREDYLVARGWRAAERLKEAGIYRQLDSGDRDGKNWGQRVASIIGSISKLMYNFTSWSVEKTEDSGSFRAAVTDARDFADECRYTAQGFVSFVASMIADTEVKVTSSRPTPDRIVYTVKKA